MQYMQTPSQLEKTRHPLWGRSRKHHQGPEGHSIGPYKEAVDEPKPWLTIWTCYGKMHLLGGTIKGGVVIAEKRHAQDPDRAFGALRSRTWRSTNTKLHKPT